MRLPQILHSVNRPVYVGGLGASNNNLGVGYQAAVRFVMPANAHWCPDITLCLTWTVVLPDVAKWRSAIQRLLAIGYILWIPACAGMIPVYV